MKDYYKILNVSVNASPMDIKKAYRSLAMRFHPDKKAGDKYAEAFFKEVQEAYAVLGNQYTRQQYTKKKFNDDITLRKGNIEIPQTPVLFLEECMQLETYIQSLNFFRMSKDGLYFHIKKLLLSSVSMLNQFADESLNDKIITSILHSCYPLSLKEGKDIVEKLSGIEVKSIVSGMALRKFLKNKEQEAFWDKCKFPVLILVTLLTCLFIYKMSRM